MGERATGHFTPPLQRSAFRSWRWQPVSGGDTIRTVGSASTSVAPVAVSFPARADEPIAADFILKNPAGETVHLSDFKGKTVLLNFWTTWCTACQEEIPRLVALQKNHPDDLTILAISLDGAAMEDADEIEGKRGTSEDPLAATSAQIHDKITWFSSNPEAQLSRGAPTPKARSITLSTVATNCLPTSSLIPRVWSGADSLAPAPSKHWRPCCGTPDEARLNGLFPFVAQAALDALAGFLRKLLRHRFRHLVGVVVSGMLEKINLPAVTSAPLAYQQMHPKSGAFGKGHRPVKRIRLQAQHLAAIGQASEQTRQQSR